MESFMHVLVFIPIHRQPKGVQLGLQGEKVAQSFWSCLCFTLCDLMYIRVNNARTHAHEQFRSNSHLILTSQVKIIYSINWETSKTFARYVWSCKDTNWENLLYTWNDILQPKFDFYPVGISLETHFSQHFPRPGTAEVLPDLTPAAISCFIHGTELWQGAGNLRHRGTSGVRPGSTKLLTFSRRDESWHPSIPLLPPQKKTEIFISNFEKSSKLAIPQLNLTNPNPQQLHLLTFLYLDQGTDDGDDKDGDNDIEASLDSAVCCQIWWTGWVHLKSKMKHEVEGDLNTTQRWNDRKCTM